ncbi:MAG: hypothetical protein AAF517_00815 [Planctomycetota bacterium]
MKLRIALGAALLLGVVGTSAFHQRQEALGGWGDDVILRNGGDLARLIDLLSHPTARSVLDRMSAAQSLWFVDSIPVAPTDSLQFRFGFGNRFDRSTRLTELSFVSEGTGESASVRLESTQLSGHDRPPGSRHDDAAVTSPNELHVLSLALSEHQVYGDLVTCLAKHPISRLRVRRLGRDELAPKPNPETADSQAYRADFTAANGDTFQYFVYYQPTSDSIVQVSTFE